MTTIDLDNDREAAVIYEGLVLLRMFIGKGDRTRLPYSEADAALVQQKVLDAHPHLRTVYEAARGS